MSKWLTMILNPCSWIKWLWDEWFWGLYSLYTSSMSCFMNPSWRIKFNFETTKSRNGITRLWKLPRGWCRKCYRGLCQCCRVGEVDVGVGLIWYGSSLVLRRVTKWVYHVWLDWECLDVNFNHNLLIYIILKNVTSSFR